MRFERQVYIVTGKQIISELMKIKGTQNNSMAAELGITQAAMWDRLNPKKTDNMTIKVLQEMSNVLGFEVIVVPSGTIVDGAYRVSDSYKKPTPVSENDPDQK